MRYYSKDRLDKITDQVLALRPEGLRSKLSMEQAELLSEVIDRKLYKARFGKFGDYCKLIDYSESYIRDVVKVWKHDLLRKSYSTIGPAKAIRIAKVVSGLGESLVPTLIEFAKENTYTDLDNMIREIKELMKDC